jgi:hypothetical protein
VHYAIGLCLEHSLVRETKRLQRDQDSPPGISLHT